jgi:hypothetical protein
MEVRALSELQDLQALLGQQEQLVLSATLAQLEQLGRQVLPETEDKVSPSGRSIPV